MNIPTLHTEIPGSPFAIPHADAYGHRVDTATGNVLPHDAPFSPTDRHVVNLAHAPVTVSLTAFDPAKSFIDGYAKQAAQTGPVRLSIRHTTPTSVRVDLSSSESDSPVSSGTSTPRTAQAAAAATTAKSIIARLQSLGLHDSADSLMGESHNAPTADRPVKLQIDTQASIANDIALATKAQDKYAVYHDSKKSLAVRTGAKLLADSYDAKLSDRTKRYNEIRDKLIAPGFTADAATQRKALQRFDTHQQLANVPLSAKNLPHAALPVAPQPRTNKHSPPPPADQVANALPSAPGERGAYLKSMAQGVATSQELGALEAVSAFRVGGDTKPLTAAVRHAEEIVHTAVQRTLPDAGRMSLPPVTDAGPRKAALTATLRQWEQLPAASTNPKAAS